MTADVANRIAQTDGIDRATQQLFISTFDSEHCAALVQIIGYDPETDFVVAPWLKGSKVTEPQYDCAAELVNGFKLNRHRYKYNYLGLLGNLLCLSRMTGSSTRFFCSEFVYYVLRESQICDFNKPRWLVKPQDLLTLNGNLVYTGDLKKIDS
jgi:hypothetical protein